MSPCFGRRWFRRLMTPLAAVLALGMGPLIEAGTLTLENTSHHAIEVRIAGAAPVTLDPDSVHDFEDLDFRQGGELSVPIVILTASGLRLRTSISCPQPSQHQVAQDALYPYRQELGGVLFMRSLEQEGERCTWTITGRLLREPRVRVAPAVAPAQASPEALVAAPPVVPVPTPPVARAAVLPALPIAQIPVDRTAVLSASPVAQVPVPRTLALPAAVLPQAQWVRPATRSAVRLPPAPRVQDIRGLGAGEARVRPAAAGLAAQGDDAQGSSLPHLLTQAEWEALQGLPGLKLNMGATLRTQVNQVDAILYHKITGLSRKKVRERGFIGVTNLSRDNLRMYDAIRSALVDQGLWHAIRERVAEDTASNRNLDQPLETWWVHVEEARTGGTRGRGRRPYVPGREEFLARIGGLFTDALWERIEPFLVGAQPARDPRTRLAGQLILRMDLPDLDRIARLVPVCINPWKSKAARVHRALLVWGEWEALEAKARQLIGLPSDGAEPEAAVPGQAAIAAAAAGPRQDAAEPPPRAYLLPLLPTRRTGAVAPAPATGQEPI